MWRYYHFTHLYHKWQSYDVWFVRYKVWQTGCFVILDHFLPFYPPNNPKYQNLEKVKKTPGDIITLHMCTINNNHMMYGSWDFKHNGQNILSFGQFFSHLPPKNTKNQNTEKMKKSTWRYYHFTQVYQISWSYAILSLRYGMWQM